MRSTSMKMASVYFGAAYKLMILDIFYCLVMTSRAANAAAQSCGTYYVVKRNDSLTWDCRNLFAIEEE